MAGLAEPPLTRLGGLRLKHIHACPTANFSSTIAPELAFQDLRHLGNLCMGKVCQEAQRHEVEADSESRTPRHRSQECGLRLHLSLQRAMLSQIWATSKQLGISRPFGSCMHVKPCPTKTFKSNMADTLPQCK